MSDRTRAYEVACHEQRNLWPDPVSEPNHFVDESQSHTGVDPDVGTFDLEEPAIACKTIVSHPATGELVQLDHGVTASEYFHHSIHRALGGKRPPVIQRVEKTMLEGRTYHD
jgi:hypothetical protein